MASSDTTINIQIDQDALRKQINDTIQQELRSAAMSLVNAAYALDPGYGAEQRELQDHYIDIQVANAKRLQRAAIVSELHDAGHKVAADIVKQGGETND